VPSSHSTGSPGDGQSGDVTASKLVMVEGAALRITCEMTEDAGAVAARLRARRVEIENAIFARVGEIAPESIGDRDTEYVAGLRQAIAGSVEYALMGIEGGEEGTGPVPPAAIVQAHRAVHLEVSLETVLRRYTAGHAVLADFVIEEAENSSLLEQGGALRELLRVQAALLDRLMASIVEEYGGELRSPEPCRSELVRRLLGEGPMDTAELGYELEGWHLGIIATGAAAGRVLRRLQAGLCCRLLSVSHGAGTLWVWFGGGQRRLTATDIELLLARDRAGEMSLAIGEPGRGIEGWRLTHRQAQEALRVALLRPRRLTRFADVALLVPWLADPTRAQAFVEIYLSPLDDLRDGGATLRETLQAYFRAAHNVNATAATLGVDRSTVRRRVRTIEDGLGCGLHTRQAELEVALRLEELQPIGNRHRCRAGRDGCASGVARSHLSD
jgi:DNA-binding transcriptional ArsR family regulator